jgi:hypothetical protein
MRVSTPQRRHLTAFAVLVAVTLTVGLVISVAWTTASDSSSPSPGSEAPAPTPTETYAYPRGEITDAGPNPWEMNDPEWALRFLERYCPGRPPLSPEMADEIVHAMRTCVAQQAEIPGHIAGP